jgi:uncharacterized protein HemX
VTPLPPTETTMPMATITLRPQPTASTPATPAAQSEGGGSSGQVMGFVGVAAVLGAAIAGAVVWRRRHDA